MPLNSYHNCWRFIVGMLLAVAVAVLVNWDACQSGRAGKLWHNLVTPRSGERETHPANAQFVIDYCRSHRIGSIALSRELGKNRFVAQPLTEGVYPTVIEGSAKVYVSYSTEVVPPGCATLRTGQGIRIARRY